MSFLTDLFKGNVSNLGEDITAAPESLAKHPSELYETIGAVGGLGLGGLAAGAAGVGDLLGGAGTAISDAAGSVGSGISNAASSVGNYLGLGSGAAADPTAAAAALDPSAGIAAGPTATADLLGGIPVDAAGNLTQDIGGAAAANTPVSTPFGSLSSTGGVLDPGSGTPAGAFGTGGSDFTATTGIDSSYGTDPTAIASSTTAGTPPTGATTGGAPTSTLGSIGSYLSNNAGALTLGGAGLAANLAAPMLAKLGLTGSIPNQGALTGVANQAANAAGGANAYAGTLESPLTTGVLPAGAQAQVTQALNDSITSIKSKYASLGLTGSTAEQAAISEAQSQSQQMTFTIAQQMAQTGIQAGNQATADLGLEGTIYNDLTTAQISQDTALQNAIASFTGAIGGGVGRGLATSAVKTAASP
jgi:hypothetical protein